MLHTVCQFGVLEPFGVLGTKKTDRRLSNQTVFSNLYKYKHVIHDEIYILEKRMEKKLK